MARVPAALAVVQRPRLGCRPCNRHVLSWQIPWRSPMRAGAIITGTPLDPLVAFAELGRMKLGEGDLQAVLGRVAELARQTLPGVVGASVTLVESDRAFTAAFAGQLALDLDETQYQEGFGPCLEVAQSAGIVTVPDMAAETRWPAFARQALAAGVRSSLSVALPLQEAVLGALNLYATQPAGTGGRRHTPAPACSPAARAGGRAAARAERREAGNRRPWISPDSQCA